MQSQLLGLSIGILAAVSAAGQSVIAAKAGLISHTEGEVYLNEKAVGISPAQLPLMRSDDLLRSGDGRAELMLSPCVVAHIDENSSLRMIVSSLEDTRIELQSGSAIVRADGRLKNDVTVFVSGSAVSLGREGVYRFEAAPPRVAVFHGKISIARNGVPVLVGPGRALPLDDPAQGILKFDTREQSAFQIWSERRIAALAKASGITDREDEQHRQNDDAARRAATMQEQTHDPSPVHFDSLAPQGPVASLPTGAPSRPRICPM